MKKQIEGFSEYYYLEGKIFRVKNDTEVKITESAKGSYLKIKSDEGKWKSIMYNTVSSLAGNKLCLDGYTKTPMDGEYYIDRNGSVISFEQNRLGIILKHWIPKDESKEYPRVCLSNRKQVSVHILMAITFLDRHYREKGLVVMHLDNNKKNCRLDNLRIGTYSENNQQAYDDGLNPKNKSR